MKDEKEIKEFLSFLEAEAKSKNKDPKQYVKELGEDGLKEAYKRFQSNKLKLALKALHGAKLNYFKSLKNQCAENEEIVYYKIGGSVQCGCKKKEQGGEVPTAKHGCSAVEKFKKARKAEPGMKMLDLVDSRKGRQQAKKEKEKAEKRRGTWAETTEYIPGVKRISKPIQTPETLEDRIYNSGKETVQESSLRKTKDRSKKFATSSVSEKCGGKVKKKACGSKIKVSCGGTKVN